MRKLVAFFVLWFLSGSVIPACAGDLDSVKHRGVLRHLGVPYANFNDGKGGGLSAELIKRFAEHLDVEYQYVRATWKDVIPGLIGRNIRVQGGEAELLDEVEVRGDLIANGLTILPWRKKILDYSDPTFPTGVWLITATTGRVRSISASGKLQQDISATKKQLGGVSVLGIAETCLDPGLYGLESTGAEIRLFGGNLNDVAPAIINGFTESALLDVPDALIALAKWPSRIRVVGPISLGQHMAVGFSRQSPELRAEFNSFLDKLKASGVYGEMMAAYYPGIFDYFPNFLR